MDNQFRAVGKVAGNKYILGARFSGFGIAFHESTFGDFQTVTLAIHKAEVYSLPDSDGVYELRALDVSQDPDAAESGSGILARITLEAASQGVSTLSISVPSISPSLTDVDGNALEPADAFGVWLGVVSDAQIAVDEACPEVVPTPTPTETVTPSSDAEDGTDLTVVWIVVGVIAGIAALGIGFVAWRRTRGRVL